MNHFAIAGIVLTAVTGLYVASASNPNVVGERLLAQQQDIAALRMDADVLPALPPTGLDAAVFRKAKPRRFVWVSAGAPAQSGNGSRDRPFARIGDAVMMARPGTAIMVKAGTYNENVLFPKKTNGTPDAPIWLVSADGPQAARIVAPREGKWAAIGGGGTDNVLVQGFHVTGGHNGIQFSQNGYDYHDTVNNIAVYGNVIDNPKEDGVKINGGSNVIVADNVITNCYDEAIDLLGIVNGQISHNSVSKVDSRTGAISVKGGSDRILIDANKISDITSDGVLVGGWTSPRMASRPGYEGFEARNVRVTGNLVQGVGKRAVNIMAAQRVDVSGNYLDVSPTYGAAIELGRNHPRAAVALYSSDVAIANNQFSRKAGRMRSMEGTGKVRFLNNRNGGRPALSAGARPVPLPFSR